MAARHMRINGSACARSARQAPPGPAKPPRHKRSGRYLLPFRKEREGPFPGEGRQAGVLRWAGAAAGSSGARQEETKHWAAREGAPSFCRMRPILRL